HGRLEHVGRTDADALVALDAALEELVLLDGAGRAHHAGREVARRPAGQPGERVKQHADNYREDRPALGNVGPGDLVLSLRQDGEAQGVVRAVLDAVEADEALALAELG